MANPLPAAASGRPAGCTPVAADPNQGDGETQSANGTFPWPAAPAGTDPSRYQLYDHTPAQSPPLRPANWSNGGGDWKLSSARSDVTAINQNPQELCGVKGGSEDLAWQVTTGRPSTVIAVLDSGIEWCQASTVDKIYLNRAALPPPEGASGATGTGADPYDLNGDGVFNVEDYANDPRIARPLFCGSFISPEDLIRAFGAGTRTGPPGFTEAIAGWNFVDNSNDPYDDVHYDHGSGEAADSTGAANASGGEVGTCPNCMVLPIRVGDSFVTSAQAFAEGVLFAVDSGASVIQEALGTYEMTQTAQQAIDYAVAHGVPVIASAADEEAEHHNQPGALQHTIVVNSITKYPEQSGFPVYNPPSYLYLNGCTNYGANVAVTVESASCSSEATGKSGGVVGLAVSAAQDAVSTGTLRPYPGLTSVTGAPVPLSANEIQQLFTMTADDVDFLTAAPPFGPPANYAVVTPPGTTRYPTKPGFDMYTGYGREDANSIVQAIAKGAIPPEAQLDSPGWFDYFDPSQTITVSGYVAAVRASSFSYKVQVAAGPEPPESAWQTLATGSGSGKKSGTLAQIPGTAVAALLAPGVDLGGRPQPDAFTFSLRVVVTDNRGLVGMDRRAGFVHHDAGLLAGYPKKYPSSIDSPPTLAPIGPGGQNALLVATAGGDVHALDPNGKELPGWPVYTNPLDYHAGEPAFSSGAVGAIPRGVILGGFAVGDLLHDGRQEVVAADLAGFVYAWTAQGKLLPGFPVRTLQQYSSPAARDKNNRLLRGIAPAPALADLEGTGKLDLVAAAMDRHLYAWRPDGSAVPGFPVLVVDRSEVQSVDPVTNRVTFKSGSNVAQGTKLMDTPAIGRLDGGSGPPDIVVGANEEYLGPVNASLASADSAALSTVPLLSPANSRLYALDAKGNVKPGWPAAIGDFDAALLPVVGDGIVNSPALADLDGSGRLRVGAISTVGPAYVLNPDGTSYYGNGPDGKPVVLTLSGGGASSNSPFYPSLPSLGSPVFAPLGPAAPGVSLVAPATSLGKALDVALPAQQQPNDVQLDAWNLSTRLFQPGFPTVMNDLEFLNQPIVANVAGEAAGPYIVEADALYDVRAVNVLGQEAPGFPKFTGGWTVNSLSFGAWGTLPTQILAAGTREGYLFLWSTPTPACGASGPWPKQHHDLANSGDLSTPQQAARCKP